MIQDATPSFKRNRRIALDVGKAEETTQAPPPVPPRKFQHIDELPNECLDLFSLGTSRTAQDLFQEYQSSRLAQDSLSESAMVFHRRIQQTNNTDSPGSAMGEMVEEVSKLLIINVSTPQIAKALGLRHGYVLKIKRFLDKKLQQECASVDVPQMFWELKKQNDTLLTALNRKLLKEANREDTSIKDLVGLAYGINDTAKTQTKILENFSKTRPSRETGLSDSEAKLAKFRDSLLDIFSASLSTSTDE